MMEETRMFMTLAIASVLVAISASAFMIPAILKTRRTLLRAIADGEGGLPLFVIGEWEGAEKCAICLGEIGPEALCECACGRLFHPACAGSAEACPYCGAGMGGMVERTPRAPACPVCGEDVHGSICSCGAVFPRRDGTILCSCGYAMEGSKPVCRGCGAVYEHAVVQGMDPDEVRR